MMARGSGIRSVLLSQKLVRAIAGALDTLECGTCSNWIIPGRLIARHSANAIADNLHYQSPRSKYMLYPYYALVWGSFAGD